MLMGVDGKIEECEDSGCCEKVSGEGERDAGRGTCEGVAGRCGADDDDGAAVGTAFASALLEAGFDFTLDDGFLGGEAGVASSSGNGVSRTFGSPA